MPAMALLSFKEFALRKLFDVERFKPFFPQALQRGPRACNPAALKQCCSDTKIVLGPLDAFRDRANTMARVKADIPEATDKPLDQWGDLVFVVVLRHQDEQVNI